MKLWEQEQAHDHSVRAVLQQHGCMDARGQIRRWTPAARAAMRDAGHTSVGAETCTCASQVDRDVPLPRSVLRR